MTKLVSIFKFSVMAYFDDLARSILFSFIVIYFRSWATDSWSTESWEYFAILGAII